MLSVTTIESNEIETPVKEPFSLRNSEILWKCASNKKYKSFEKYSAKQIRITVHSVSMGKVKENFDEEQRFHPAIFLSITKVSPNKSS